MNLSVGILLTLLLTLVVSMPGKRHRDDQAPVPVTKKTKRPDFTNKVDEEFSKIRETIMKDTCKSNFWCLVLLKLALHRCHVFPYATIRDIMVDNWKSNPEVLKRLVTAIFLWDTESYTVKRWYGEGYVIPDYITDRRGEELLLIPHAVHAQFDTVYASVKKLNEDMEKEAENACLKDKNDNECLKLLNSAPANLRWGWEKLNVKIGDNLDFMGGEEIPNLALTTGELTEREKGLLILFMECKGKMEPCIYSIKEPKTYCLVEEGPHGLHYWLLLSSTRDKGYVRVPMAEATEIKNKICK